ncbi:MAG: ATP-binding protein, partial [Gaiellaceae bacterium]
VALTANAVSYGDRKQAKAKGFDGDILTGFPVEGLTPRSARRTIPFVGRSSELAILRESLHRATSTGHPVLVSVLGEPGIGKSRLADELTAIVEDDVPVLVGRARPFTDTATFSPAATIVAELAGLEEDEPPEKTRRRIHELADRTVPPGDAKGLVERLALLFGMAEQRTHASFVQDVQAGFVALVDGLARDTPAVLVFEDAHELRPPMLELIERLGSPARDGHRKALVLVLARTSLLEERPSWGTTTANAVRLQLEPLSPDESIDLARQASGRRIEDAEAVEIAERAGGNPLFLQELVAARAHADGAEEDELPETVEAVVASRIDRLSAADRSLLRWASVLGQAFPGELVAAVVEDEAAAGDSDAWNRLAEFVERDPDVPGGFRFRHALIRDAAYDALPKAVRADLHARFASWLEEHGTGLVELDEVLGYHLEQAFLYRAELGTPDDGVLAAARQRLTAAGRRASLRS